MTDYPSRPRRDTRPGARPAAAPVDGVGSFCANCQSPMAPDAAFCNRCGAPRLTRDTSPTEVLPVTRPLARETVVEEEVRQDAPLVATGPPTGWSWPLVALAILATLILLLVLFLAFFDDDDDADTPPTTTVVPTVPTTVAVPVPVQPPATVVVPVPVPGGGSATTAAT